MPNSEAAANFYIISGLGCDQHSLSGREAEGAGPAEGDGEWELAGLSNSVILLADNLHPNVIW